MQIQRVGLSVWWIGLLGILSISSSALAWSDHPLGAYPALSVMPEVADAAPVNAESLESFLKAEQANLVQVFAEEEVWARANVTNYPTRPDGLAFNLGDDDTLRKRFLEALRVNPTIKTPLYIHALPGEDIGDQTALAWQKVTILKGEGSTTRTTFVALEEGQEVTPLKVAATACDEPDYGLDIGLFEDNDTEFGARYGWGTQPFGNKKLEFGTQAPFHMGFFHESGIVYSLAPFVGFTFPEARLHMYLTLARFAFKTGHDYWGWRFVGWGLHYIQDLTQPYHSTLLPGVSVPRMLWINTISMIGLGGAKEDAVQLVSNRHLAIEDYQYGLLVAVYKAHSADHPVMTSLKDTQKDAAFPAFSDGYVKEQLTLQSNARSTETDTAIVTHFPERMVDQPTYVLGQTEPGLDVYETVIKEKPEAEAPLDALVADLLGAFGIHSRAYVRAALAEGN